MIISLNLTGRALNAECRVISQGGWGVFSGWDNDRRHAIPLVYDKICGLASDSTLGIRSQAPDGISGDRYGAGKPYDFSSWIPDAVIINLGTNDREGFNQPPFTDPDTGEVYKLNVNPDGSPADEDIELIINAAVCFLKKVRKNSPSSHIVWLYGMLGYDLGLPLAEALNRYKAETGDNNIAFIMLPGINDKTVGARSHPGYEAHRITAGIIIDHLKKVL